MARRRKGTGSVHRRGEGYRVRLMLPDGREVSRTVATREDGQRLLRGLREEAVAMEREGRFEPPEEPPEETLTTWGAGWMDRREGRVAAPHKERSRWRCYVEGTPLAKIPLRQIRPADVASWLDGLEAHPRRPAPGTCALALAMVRKALADARRLGKIDTNPAEGIPMQRKAPQRERVYLTGGELRAVVECDAIPARARACYAFAALTGLRPGELWALRWGDLTLDGERPEVVVRRSHDRETTKGGRVRAVPLLPGALLALSTLRVLGDFTTDPDDLVFPSTTGLQRLRDDDHGWSSRKVRGVPRVGHRELAGVRRDVDFYGLRHACASLLTMGDLTGAPVEAVAVQRWMGHASITTTMRYAHLAPDYLHRVVAEVREEASQPAADPLSDPLSPRIEGKANRVPPSFSSTLEGTRTPDRRIRNTADNAVPQGVSAHRPSIRPSIEPPGEPPAEGLEGVALALLRAVDEGAPAVDLARALALAVLSTEPPGSTWWTAAVGIVEGGPLRTRRAVMLAGEVLGDRESVSLSERSPTRATDRA